MCEIKTKTDTLSESMVDNSALNDLESDSGKDLINSYMNKSYSYFFIVTGSIRVEQDVYMRCFSQL